MHRTIQTPLVAALIVATASAAGFGAEVEDLFPYVFNEPASTEYPSLNIVRLQSGDSPPIEDDAGPDHIRDNAFLVEEAFNQEPDEIQHIFNWIRLWDQFDDGRTREFAYTYTIEIPLGSQDHRFSITTAFLSSYERFAGTPPEHRVGLRIRSSTIVTNCWRTTTSCGVRRASR